MTVKKMVYYECPSCGNVVLDPPPKPEGANKLFCGTCGRGMVRRSQRVGKKEVK